MSSSKAEHDCATEFLNDLRKLSPTWANKIDAMREERRLNPRQMLGSLAAYTLDTDMYLVVPDHAFFTEDGIRPAGTKALCPVCDAEYALEYPGQPLCRKPECAAAFYAQPKSAPDGKVKPDGRRQ